MTDLFSLEGRVALVTGSTQGIGLALAEGLAEHGATIVVNGRDAGRCRATAEALAPRFAGRVHASAFDVTAPDEVERAVIAIENEVGPIDILVNNAGIQRRAPLENYGLNTWRELMTMNLESVFIVGQAVARRMIPRGRGKIINITSLQAEAARPSIAPYTASKGGVKNLTHGMCADWARYGLQVNAIGPGYFATPLNQALIDDPVFDAWLCKRTPAGRWGRVEELKGATVFLASSASDFVNGQTIYVDGGVLSVLYPHARGRKITMTSDVTMIVAGSVLAVLASVVLVIRYRIHPFLSLVTMALLLALGLRGDIVAAIGSVQKGFGDVLGGAGIVIALGLALGAMLDISGAAATLAHAALRNFSAGRAKWAVLAASMIIGLPLFFETGVVLLLPIVSAAAAAVAGRGSGQPAKQRTAILLSALAGLSVLHCLLPPHPGPLLAVAQFNANVGRTMIYGLMVAVPTAILAGPLFGTFVARFVDAPAVAAPGTVDKDTDAPPSVVLSAGLVLLPVVLITGREFAAMAGWPAGLAGAILATIGTPIAALVISNFAALILLFARRGDYVERIERVWQEAMSPAGTILLSIGAGGALKQVLVDAGLSRLLAVYAATSTISPLLLGWLVAVAIRLATGSATVATVTAAGVMSGVAQGAGVSPEWLVLAIGTGSVFLSHVSDPGFWLVKGYLGLSTADTFKTWSSMETVISVVGIAMILLLSQLI